MEIGQGPASSASKEHQKIYQDWFTFTDSDGDGCITGPDAIKFFAMSKLSRPDLKQVWAIADSRRQGYLGFSEFVTAMQLVSLAQAGNQISQDSLKRDDLNSLNPPVMEGLDALLAKSKHLVKRVDPDIDVGVIVWTDSGPTLAAALDGLHRIDGGSEGTEIECD